MPGADTLLRLYAPCLVNAMGCIERPIAFVDNDLPGIMLTGAAERLLADHGVRAGMRVVLFGNHDRLYCTALRLRAGGAGIAAIVDTRAASGSPQRAALLQAGVECLLGHAILRAYGAAAVRAVHVAPTGAARATRRIDCDALLVSGGWSPALRATALRPWHRSCGAAAGVLTLAGMGGAFAGATGADGEPDLAPYWRSPAPRRHERRQFVDLQNDVTVADHAPGLVEGFRRHRARQALYDARRRHGAGSDRRRARGRIVAERTGNGDSRRRPRRGTDRQPRAPPCQPARWALSAACAAARAAP